MSQPRPLLPAWSKLAIPNLAAWDCSCGQCCAWRVAMMHPKAKRLPSSVLQAAFGLN